MPPGGSASHGVLAVGASEGRGCVGPHGDALRATQMQKIILDSRGAVKTEHKGRNTVSKHSRQKRKQNIDTEGPTKSRWRKGELCAKERQKSWRGNKPGGSKSTRSLRGRSGAHEDRK